VVREPIHDDRGRECGRLNTQGMGIEIGASEC
jgi:hypothetical protein